jgi:hypothetical protein
MYRIGQMTGTHGIVNQKGKQPEPKSTVKLNQLKAANVYAYIVIRAHRGDATPPPPPRPVMFTSKC